MRWRPAHLQPPHLGGHRAWAAVHFGADKLHYAVTHETDGRLVVTHEAAAESAGSLRQKLDPREYHIAIALPCEDVLCRALRLPTINEHELRQMLDLQIDQLTPLPLDEVVYDFEPLEQRGASAVAPAPREAEPAVRQVRSGTTAPAGEPARSGAGPTADPGQNGVSTLVLVAIARKSVVNQRVAALEDAGLPPDQVGVDALALFHSLLRGEAIPRDSRLSTLVCLQAEVTHLIVCADGWPLLVRSVFRSGNAAWDGTVLGEELRRTQLAAETEWPGRGAGVVVVVLADLALEPAAQAMLHGWPSETRVLTNAAVPSMARCLCPATREERRFNLLPDEWRQRRRAARARRLVIRFGIVLGAAYVLALAGILAAHLFRKAQSYRLGVQRHQLEPDYQRARQLHETLVALEKQLDTKYSALEALREVSQFLPPSVKLTSFSFRRDDAVTLKGQADGAQAVYDFIGRLHESDLFSAVKPGNMPTQGGLTRFEVVATLKSAAGRSKGGG